MSNILVVTDTAPELASVLFDRCGVMVIGPGGALLGHRFELIVVALSEVDPRIDWVEWYGHLRTKLEPNGVIVGLPPSIRDAIAAARPVVPERHAALWRALAVNL